VAQLARLPPGTGMMVVGPFDKPMALFNVGGGSRHQWSARIGGPSPTAGSTAMSSLPLAWLTFDVRTGRPDHPGGHCVAAYEVECPRRDIYVGWIKA
jgi:hypothetical protein